MQSFSPVSVALLMGLILSKFVRNNSTFQPGLTFTFRNLLRLATILLGLRLGLKDVYSIGLDGIVYIAITIVALFVLNSFLRQYFKTSKPLTTLITMGTAICGISAILATSSVIKARKEETSTAVAIISLFGFLALILYPFAANFIFPQNEWAVGVFLGVAIHDTAQVLGASLLYQQLYQAISVLDVAVVIKLIRNLCLVLALPIAAYLHNRNSENTIETKFSFKTLIPPFIYFFLACVFLRALGDMNDSLAFGFLAAQKWWNFLKFADSTATFFLTASTAAIGLETNLFSISKNNIRAIGLGLTTALSAGLIVIVCLKIAGN